MRHLRACVKDPVETTLNTTGFPDWRPTSTYTDYWAEQNIEKKKPLFEKIIYFVFKDDN